MERQPTDQARMPRPRREAAGIERAGAGSANSVSKSIAGV